MDIKYVQCIQTLLQCGVKTGRLHPNRCMIKVVLLWCLGGVDFRGRFQFGLFVNIKLITFLVQLTIITPSQPYYRSAGIQFMFSSIWLCLGLFLKNQNLLVQLIMGMVKTIRMHITGFRISTCPAANILVSAIQWVEYCF